MNVDGCFFLMVKFGSDRQIRGPFLNEAFFFQICENILLNLTCTPKLTAVTMCSAPLLSVLSARARESAELSEQLSCNMVSHWTKKLQKV